MDAILRTAGTFTIKYQNKEATALALQISRNLFQYFSADSAIVATNSHTETGPGNMITLAIGDNQLPSVHPDFAIQLSEKGLAVRKSNGNVRVYGDKSGLGAIFLRPLLGERLELVVWGVDESGLVDAARLVPMLAGVGQPDFVVLRRESRWRGVEGVAAMGFFDQAWNVSQTAVVD